MTSDEATVRDDVVDATHDDDPTAAPGGGARPVPGQRAGLTSPTDEQQPDGEPTVTPAAAAQEKPADTSSAGEPDGDRSGDDPHADAEPPTAALPAAPPPATPAVPPADPWADAGTEVWQAPLGGPSAPAPAPPEVAVTPDEADWSQEYSDRDLFTAIVSAPALSLAAFAFAVAGLLGGMIPESLPYLVQMDEQSGPVQHIKIVAFITLGFAIVSASLGFASLLRSIGSSLRWPRYLGGAAVLLAILIALQSALLLVLAWLAPSDVPR